jgi:2-dehydropantoate 2-reductase
VVLGRVLGPEQVIGGVAHIAAMIEKPAVSATPAPWRTSCSASWTARAQSVSAPWQLPWRPPGSITGSATTSSATSGRRWRSFSSFAGMTTLMRRPIGPIREDAGTPAMLREGLAEAFAVARAKGIVLPDEFVERTLERCDRLPYEMKSSMLQDLEARPPPRAAVAVRRDRAPGPGARRAHPDPRVHRDRAQAAVLLPV